MKAHSDLFHDSQGPVQNKNGDLFVQKSFRISGQQQ